ncbi:hypothetical protein HRbin30_02779 [bacterium HR30]|nr:hypothetical protein HRbin30_02779 [bacterium HR30]
MPMAAVLRVFRVWCGRGALVLFGVFAACGIIEILLQAGAKMVDSRGAEPVRPPWHPGKVRILALGDSNTYGLWVGKEAAYPKVFERLWNQPGRRPQVEVLNLGYPGTNSSQVLAQCDRYLAVFRPDVVTLMLGANDAWTQPVPTNTGSSLRTTVRQWLWRTSRLYRLAYLLARARENASLDVVPLSDPSDITHGHGVARFGTHQFELGHRMANVAAPPGWMEQAESHLRGIVECGHRWGVPVVFLTYVSGHFIYNLANDLLRHVAQSTGTPLVDVNKELEPHCPRWKCEELFPDQHPTEKGHVRVAQALVGFFDSQFRERRDPAGAQNRPGEF